MKINYIKNNPNNPRILKDDKFKKLVKSIQEFPKMMELRPIIIDNDNIVLGGNMRLKALKELKYKDIPDTWVKRAADLTDKEKEQFIIKDNVGFGEWDWDILANEWENEKLIKWGIDVDLEISCGNNGNDWNYNYKEQEQVGDGLSEKLGFPPHSMWYGIPRDYGKIKDKLVKLPERLNKNPHQDKYSRTNPESIRRIIKMYMREGDLFLENCCGWSTFGSIAKHEGFSGVGIDIWDTAIELSIKQIIRMPGNGDVEIKKMDGMNTEFKDDNFDYIYCNPPFMDTEMYSGEKNDIATKDRKDFESKFIRLMKENYRVLKKGSLCTITIADQRKAGILIPNQKLVIDSGLSAGFVLHDFVVVEQLGVANMYRKKAYLKRRSPKNHEYVITFLKLPIKTKRKQRADKYE